MYINLRMIDVMGCNAPFGGVPLIVFGDLLQLEPVNGKPPYETLSSSDASNCIGGFPCEIPLWKLFQYKELTTNNRQAGQENENWRQIPSNERLGPVHYTHLTLPQSARG